MTLPRKISKEKSALFSENINDALLGLLGWGVSYIGILAMFLGQQDLSFTRSLAIPTFVYSTSYLKSFTMKIRRMDGFKRVLHIILTVAFIIVFFVSVYTILTGWAYACLTIGVVVALSVFVLFFLIDIVCILSGSEDDEFNVSEKDYDRIKRISAFLDNLKNIKEGEA